MTMRCEDNAIEEVNRLREENERLRLLDDRPVALCSRLTENAAALRACECQLEREPAAAQATRRGASHAGRAGR